MKMPRHPRDRETHKRGRVMTERLEYLISWWTAALSLIEGAGSSRAVNETMDLFIKQLKSEGF